MKPRDELELNVLERTGDLDIAEDVGGVVQMILEAHAGALSWLMGVPPEALMDALWATVDTK